MKKGLIYSILDWIFENLKYLNLVELFKFIAVKIKPNHRISALRFSVDVFIILKWTFIVLIWNLGVNNDFINAIVWYLIFTNVYTYFYYHTWSNTLNKAEFDFDRIKRRFLNLGLSVGFNVFSFAYLFAQPFSNNFKWVNGISTFRDSILFSLANSFTTSYESVSTSTTVGQQLTLIETTISFVFLTIILSNSIPQIKSD